MSRRLLILRPQPEADATAARALALGLEPAICPLFVIVPRVWTAPAGAFDALMLTSAAAARHGGAQLARYRALPVYAVGVATAAAARAAGFDDVRVGVSGVAALIDGMAHDGVKAALHLAGRDTAPHRAAPFSLTRVAIYEAAVVDRPPLPPSGVALVHSTRAAHRFAALVNDRAAFDAVAISAAVGDVMGGGWRSHHCAPTPDDAAMLALAAPLCKD